MADEKVTLDTNGQFSTVNVKKVTSDYAGVYKITATNEVGEDTAEFTVEVIGENFLQKSFPEVKYV